MVNSREESENERCSIWLFAQISDNFYYLDISPYARYFVALLFKESDIITIREL